MEQVDSRACNGPQDCNDISHVHLNTAPKHTFIEKADNRVVGCNSCHKTIPAGTTFLEGNFTSLLLYFCSLSCFENGPSW